MTLKEYIESKITEENGADAPKPRFLRLEARTRARNFTDGLPMPTADPLWMLGRQWQFGEFQGEDNGAVVNAKVFYKSKMLNQTFSVKGDGTADQKDLLHQTIDDIADANRIEVPVEAVAECTHLPLGAKAEAAEWSSKLRRINWRNRVRIGQQLERYLEEHPDHPVFKEVLRQTFPIERKENDRLDEKTVRFVKLMQGKVPDGGEILYQFYTGKIQNTLKDTVIKFRDYEPFLERLRSWYDDLFLQPQQQLEDNPVWQPQQLLHKFGISDSENGNEKLALSAPDYQNGDLDWYSFDRMTADSQIEFSENQLKSQEHLPVNISFSGMPNKRLFTFEDNRMDFANLEANLADLTTLMLTEFALVSSNDWFIIPLELSLGTATWIERLEVKDSFGIETTIQNDAKTGPFLSEKPLEVWDVFKVRDERKAAFDLQEHFLYLSPVAPYKQESEPLEEVLFMRDEYANMVWGVEKTIMGSMGNPINGFDYHRTFNPELPEGIAINASGHPDYRLSNATTVPYNWIPYVPRHEKGKPNSIILRRARLARTDENIPKYLSGLLDELTRVREESIPRSGVRIQLTKQRVRWTNGETYVWMGRKVKTGRGEGNSGLRFDYLEG